VKLTPHFILFCQPKYTTVNQIIVNQIHSMYWQATLLQKQPTLE